VSTTREVGSAISVAQPDQQAIIEAVKLLHPGHVVELRILNLDRRGGTASGYFDQPALLAQAALRCNRRAEGIYITLNPVSTDMLARINNRVEERAKDTTKDSEVLRRVWFPIDLDPQRPSGISSSEDEHQAALEQARRVREWLSSEWGWHAPIFADSGNGAHLLYAIDLPNDAASTDLLKRCLAALARRFNTEAVTLDRSVYNAARIWKLYGSVARKGEHLPQRPHRLAQIINAPDPVERVTRGQLEALAASLPPDPAPKGRAASLDAGDYLSLGGPVTAGALLAWLERHGAKVRRKQEPGCTIYVLKRCPFADHHAPGKACVTLRDDGTPGFKCQTAGCAAYHWRDLLALWGDGPTDEPELAAPPSLAASGDGRAQVFSAGAARPWPEMPGKNIYHGLAGEIVDAITPHTEADPVAILVQLLTAFGAAIGHGPHFFVGGSQHEPRLFSVIVGKSAKARKGDSWQPIRRLLLASGEAPRIQTSLSSGEGLVWLVRDPVVRQRFIEGKRGQQGHYEQVIEDEGEPEKRVLVVSGELAQILKVMRREGNTLSPVLRDAWDHGDLTITTKTLAARASSAYLSVIGHITVDELRQELRSLDAANGFANRFCWFAVKRSQELPIAERIPEATMQRLAARLGEAIRRARAIGEMQRDHLASEKWIRMYHNLTTERGGFAGALISRSEAQVLRLSMLYALLDGSSTITYPHLQAATQLWAYSERSIEYLFGGLAGNPLADKIAAFLKEHGTLNRGQIYHLLHNSVSAGAVTEALRVLAAQGKAACEMRQTGGRPAEVWQLVAD
jgi:hypothetical protein